jgi:alkyl hydroperoxide reductase subunit D
MSIDALKDRLPAYAKDLGVNLTTLADETVLDDQKKWGAFLASAYAVGEPVALKAIAEAAKDGGLSDEAATAAKAAAAIMGMNNVYYRTLHQLHNPEYKSMRAGLRMSVIGNPGVDKIDFELWSLAVSSINGCAACLDSHEAELKTHAMPANQIQCALRIAAVVYAVSRVLAAESAAA